METVELDRGGWGRGIRKLSVEPNIQKKENVNIIPK